MENQYDKHVSGLKVRTALAERRLSAGTWIQTGHTAVAGIFSCYPFDWIAVDCEHSDIGLPEMAALLAEINGPAPFVRVRENDTLAIRHALDNGAQGIIVPLVNSAEEAAKAVKAAKYPPQGCRGFGFCRANDWGRSFDKYIRDANSSISLVVMIESAEGVKNIDEILATDGVDGIFVGPYDLSGSYGIPGQTSHPVVEKALDTLLASCARHGKSAGIHIVHADEAAIRRQVGRGFTFVALGTDIVFLHDAADAVSRTVESCR